MKRRPVGLTGGTIDGGLLVPAMRLTGTWLDRRGALEALAARRVDRVVIGAGGASPRAFASGPGSHTLQMPPANLAVRVRTAHPGEVTAAAPWLQQAIDAENLRGIVDGDVVWQAAGDDGWEGWIPVTLRLVSAPRCGGRPARERLALR